MLGKNEASCSCSNLNQASRHADAKVGNKEQNFERLRQQLVKSRAVQRLIPVCVPPSILFGPVGKRPQPLSRKLSQIRVC